jgi:predicted ribonuclease YlaK
MIAIIDTNVIADDPFFFNKFKNTAIVLPMVVLEELDKLKSYEGLVGKNCRTFIKQLRNILRSNNRNGTNTFHFAKDKIKSSVNDNIIIHTAQRITKSSKKSVTLYTNDINMQIKAKSLDIDAKSFEFEPDVSIYEQSYKELTVTDETLALLAQGHAISVDNDYSPNQYVLVNGALPVKYNAANGTIKRLVSIEDGIMGLKTKNLEQVFAMDALLDDNIKLVSLIGQAGTGKAQPLDSKLLTPSGWVFMGDIKVGDLVIGKNGKPTKVMGVFPQGKKSIYEVKFSDDTIVECCDEHLWTVQSSKDRDRKLPYKTMQLKDMIKDGITLPKRGDRKNYSIPLVEPVEFNKKNHFIHPYILGSLIGDGTMIHQLGISSADFEIVDKFNNLIDNKYHLVKRGKYDYYIHRKERIYGNISNPVTKFNLNGNINKTYMNKSEITNDGFSINSIEKAIASGKVYKNYYWKREDVKKLSTNEYKQALIDLGLWGKKSYTKFIPNDYLFDSVENRIALLQGLMDTDGTLDKRTGSTSYSTSSFQLSCDFMELIRSLGGFCRSTSKIPTYTYLNQKKIGARSYTIHFKLPNNIDCFSLKRKLDKTVTKTKYKSDRKYISETKYIGEKECQCIMVDSEDHLYVTDGYNVTHNTLISLAAALHKTLDEGKYDNIIIARPTVSMGEDLGYLPGPQPLDAKILTPNGWTTMGELKVGDKVSCGDGTFAPVLNIYPKGIKDVYKITTTDGTSTEACDDHLWLTQTHENKKRGKVGSIKTTNEIRNSLKNKKGNLNHYLPRNSAITFLNNQNDITIPPYLLGVLIGNGCYTKAAASVNFTTIDNECLNRIIYEASLIGCNITKNSDISYTFKSNLFNNKPAKLVKIENLSINNYKIYNSIGIALKDNNINRSTMHNRCNNNLVIDNIKYSFIDTNIKYTNKIKTLLNDLNIYGKKSYEKSIPDAYKFSTIETRLNLLRGLMDTDGNCKKNGEATFTTTSLTLANDIVHLVRSLGGRSTIMSRDRIGKVSTHKDRKIISRRISYSVSISLTKEYNPFFIKRKAERFKCQYIHSPVIKSIELVGQKETQCIKIDHPDHLYITDNFIVTHNTAEEKLAPWAACFFDNIDFLLGGYSKCGSAQSLLDVGVIKLESLSHMRGRSLSRKYILLDEIQNFSKAEIKTLLTRAGEGTKIVIMGDVYQIDNRHVDITNNGLTYATEQFREQGISANVTLTKSERSELAMLAGKLL